MNACGLDFEGRRVGRWFTSSKDLFGCRKSFPPPLPRTYGARVNLETPLAELDVVPVPRARQLERFGVRTVGALLMHFPRRYDDRTQFDHFPAETGDRASSAESRRSFRLSEMPVRISS